MPGLCSWVRGCPCDMKHKTSTSHSGDLVLLSGSEKKKKSVGEKNACGTLCILIMLESVKGMLFALTPCQAISQCFLRLAESVRVTST